MTDFVSEVALVEFDGAPPPLSPLRDVVISPENIAAEQRRKTARTLTFWQRRKIRAALRQAQSELEKEYGYSDMRQRRKQLKDELNTLALVYEGLKQRLHENPDDESLHRNLEIFMSKANETALAWQQLEMQYRAIWPSIKNERTLARRLHEHELAKHRIRAEKRLRQMMVEEARIYESLIIDKWTSLGFCHRYTKDGREHVHKVTFSEVAINIDSIYYKIDAAYQTVFKAWRTNLPEGVYVAKQLLHEDTLTELSITCQRQVSGEYNTNGAWVVVHRLESTDGLMNYVSFSDVLGRYPSQHNSRLPVCCGVGANRQVQWVNLADFPHWLIAGYTNSGKSNMVNSGICTLITQHSPDDLRLVLIDLKGGLEFDFYSEIPHLYGDVVSTVSKVAETLANLEALMHHRFAKFRGVAKRLETYKAKRPNDPMPRILVVFDEVASIMDNGDLTKRILASLRELTRMGRAVGIHIWLCTQRPDVKAVEGAIKANLAVRLSGRMTTSGDSVTVLGNSRARDLAPVAGRMILQIGPDPVAVQTPHITDDNISDSLKIASSFPAPVTLDAPAAVVVHQQWTPESIIELSLKHLGGKITYKAVYDACEGLSQSQARKMVEIIWNMPTIEHDGKFYRVELSHGKVRRLVEIESADNE